MARKPTSKRTRPKAKAVLRLPDLEQAKSAVLNSLTSVDAQRGYWHATDIPPGGTSVGRSPGLRTYWEIHFARGPMVGETEVRQVMKAPLGRLGRAALALIGKFPAEEVSANLHRLKQVVETGRVTDTSYSVAGKFAERPNQRQK